MRVMTIAGTRPDLIKLSEIIKRLDAHTDHTFVHTGQNYDKNLHDVFFDDLGLRRPDYTLGVGGGTLGQTLGKLMEQTENVLEEVKPDAVVILGDTNSSLSGIIVKRRKIPLFHLEAGNRCFDDNVPEEVNRRILDHISDVNLVFSENSRRYLLSEGRPKDRTFLMGSPMREVLDAQAGGIKKSKVLKRLGLKKYYLFSIHRDENTEIQENFVKILASVNLLADVTNSTIVMPLHPRTAKKLEGVELHPNVMFTEPFGFTDYIKLQQNATCVISDSGTLAEESAILGFPAVTVRNAIERPEAIDHGSMIFTQPDAQSIVEAVSMARKPTSCPEEYKINNCSDRVVKIIKGYTDYVNRYVYIR